MAKKMIALEETSQTIKTNTETIIGAQSGTRAVVDDIKKILSTKKYRWGVRIDKNNSDPYTSVEYLYDAVGKTPAAMNFSTGVFSYGSWFDWYVIEQNKPAMVKYDGTVDYYLDPQDYTKKADGTASDVANTNYSGNAMAKFPIIWRYQYEDGNYQYDIFSNVKYDENYEAYAFQRADGSYMKYRWHRIFRGAEVSGRLRSISGLQPLHDKNANQERTLALANNPSGKSVWDMTANSMCDLITGMMRLISKCDNSQAKFGNGNLNYQSSASPTYGVLKTGTLNNKGQFWGANDNTHQMKAFHCEAIYADIWERVLGYLALNGVPYLKPTPPYNFTGEGYIKCGEVITGTSGGYISKTKMTKYGEVPQVVSGSETTYKCDGCWFNVSLAVGVALRGGDCSNSSRCGFSCVNLDNSASVSNWNFGASLSCEGDEDYESNEVA